MTIITFTQAAFVKALELTDHHQHLNGMNGVMIGMFTESIKYGED